MNPLENINIQELNSFILFNDKYHNFIKYIKFNYKKLPSNLPKLIESLVTFKKNTIFFDISPTITGPIFGSILRKLHKLKYKEIKDRIIEICQVYYKDKSSENKGETREKLLNLYVLLLSTIIQHIEEKIEPTRMQLENPEFKGNKDKLLEDFNDFTQKIGDLKEFKKIITNEEKNDQVYSFLLTITRYFDLFLSIIIPEGEEEGEVTLKKV